MTSKLPPKPGSNNLGRQELPSTEPGRVDKLEQQVAGLSEAMTKFLEAMAAKPQVAEPKATETPQMTAVDTANASLVKRVLNSNRTAAAKFLLVVVPDSADPYLVDFQDVDDLITKIKTLMEQPCHVFPILGAPLAIVGDKFKQLATPLGLVPLFDIPGTEIKETTHSSWLGKSINKTITVEIEEEDDEEYEDEE